MYFYRLLPLLTMNKLLFLLIPFFGFSQSNTEVFVFDYNFNPEGFEISNFTNISNNPGYDNQPSFDFDDFILYARTNNNQTDIYQYAFQGKTNTRVNKPTLGGEYSPQRIPGSFDIAAVRLDTSGLQRLYKYDERSGASTVLLNNLQVAYYTFFNKDTIVSAVLDGNDLDLVISSISHKTNDTITNKVGRSISNVPHSNNCSYTVINEDGNHDLYIIDMKTGDSFFVCELPIGVEDYAWLDGDRIIIGSNSSIFVYDLFGNQKWEKLIDLSPYSILNITHLTVNSKLKKMAIVAELSQ